MCMGRSVIRVGSISINTSTHYTAVGPPLESPKSSTKIGLVGPAPDSVGPGPGPLLGPGPGPVGPSPPLSPSRSIV